MLWLVLGCCFFLGPLVALFFFSRSFTFEQVVHSRDPGELGLSFEEIRFPTRRGKELYGWWIPGRPEAPVLILVHGWKRNLERMLDLVPMLIPEGYSLLLFDARSHGSSDADGQSHMLKFSEDIRAAVDEVKGRRSIEGCLIGVLGHSVGGAASIHAASIDERISCVVSIGAFAHPGRLMRRDFLRKGVPPLLVDMLLRYISFKIGASLDEIAPLARLPMIKRPVMIIHGENDEIVPVEHGKELASVGGPTVSSWFLVGRGHSDCGSEHAFREKLLTFLRRSLC